MVLRLSYWRVLRRPGASRPSLASVGSTGARTGRSGASKLANAASRIRRRLFGADVCHWPRLCGAQSGGPGMSALTPLLGLSRRERRSLCFHYTRDGASIITRPSRAPLIWTRYAPASAALNPSMGQVYFHIATASIIANALAN